MFGHEDHKKILRSEKEILKELRELREEVEEIEERLPYLKRIRIGGLNMGYKVGQTFTATVSGLDQFGNPFPIDFTANPPSWSVSDPAGVTMNPDPVPGTEDFMVVAPSTSEIISVAVAGHTASVTVAIEQPAPVLTSLQIALNPPA